MNPGAKHTCNQFITGSPSVFSLSISHYHVSQIIAMAITDTRQVLLFVFSIKKKKSKRAWENDNNKTVTNGKNKIFFFKWLQKIRREAAVYCVCSCSDRTGMIPETM